MTVDVRDGDRDHAHLDLLEKCEILSTHMPMIAGTVMPVGDQSSSQIPLLGQVGCPVRSKSAWHRRVAP